MINDEMPKKSVCKKCNSIENVEYLKDLLEKVIENEQEWQDSDEYLIEEIRANEYEYKEDGTRY